MTLWMLLLAQVCDAQQHRSRRLPDSVSTEVDEIPPTAVDTVVVKADSAAHTGETYVDGGTASDTAAANDSTVEDIPASYRNVPDTSVRRMQGDKDLAYANDPAYWKKEKQDSSGSNNFMLWLAIFLSSDGFRIFFYGLLAAILIYAFYRIISENNLRLFYKRPSAVAMEQNEETMAEVDLDDRLRQALLDKDHRAATRYLYLKSLRQLEEREWIRYHIQATGQDYVQQMNMRQEGAAFRQLNNIYERVWYGEFPVSDEQFGRVHQYFLNFYSTLGRTA